MSDSFQSQAEMQTGTPSQEGKRSPEARGGRKRWLVLIVVVLVAAVAGYYVRQHYAVRETTDDAQINGSIIPISPRVAGTVEEVLVEENQQVEAGTVLFRIDPTDYSVAMEHAQAELAKAEASAHGARTSVPIASTTTGSNLSTAQAGVRVASSEVATTQKGIDAARSRVTAMEAQLRQAEANHQNAVQNFERYQQLIANDEISRQQYDAAVTAVDATKAAADAAQAAVDTAGQDAAVAESRLEQAQARLLQAQAELRSAETAPARVTVTESEAQAAEAEVRLRRAEVDRAQLDLDYTTVKAPVDGVVSKKSLEVGMNVERGQPVLALVPLNDLWITANFKETQLTEMHPGQRVEVSVDTYDGHKYEGYVESIAAATGEKFSVLPPENATGNFVKVVQRIPVKIRLDEGQDPEQILRPGMSTVVTVLTK